MIFLLSASWVIAKMIIKKPNGLTTCVGIFEILLEKVFIIWNF